MAAEALDELALGPPDPEAVHEVQNGDFHAACKVGMTRAPGEPLDGLPSRERRIALSPSGRSQSGRFDP